MDNLGTYGDERSSRGLLESPETTTPGHRQPTRLAGGGGRAQRRSGVDVAGRYRVTMRLPAVLGAW